MSGEILVTSFDKVWVAISFAVSVVGAYTALCGSLRVWRARAAVR